MNDNVDTANKDTSALDMMPIVNLFNEWHAASTSKKIKAVIEANANAGKYRTTCAPFGYTKGDDPNHLPVIDPDAAPIVRNIFEMRASGISPHHIADKLNEDGVPIPLTTTTQSSASLILVEQDICGVPKRYGRYSTITPYETPAESEQSAKTETESENLAPKKSNSRKKKIDTPAESSHPTAV